MKDAMKISPETTPGRGSEPIHYLGRLRSEQTASPDDAALTAEQAGRDAV